MQNRIPLLLLSFFLLLFSPWTMAQAPTILQIQFDSDQDTLTSLAENQLSTWVSNRQQPATSYRAWIVGHTDNQGSLSYNQDLSRRRAERVQTELRALGFVDEQMSLDYRAYLDPVDQANTEQARARNRRVDVVLETLDGRVSNDFQLLDAKQGGILVYSRSETRITIPPNAFTYPDGSPVEGDVLVTYREFRDFADFMLTDIPMNFNWQGEQAFFSSTGMFELRAYDLEQKALAIAPQKSVDIAFDQTSVQEGTAFWRYDEGRDEWQSGNSYVAFEEEAMVRVQTGTRYEKLGDVAFVWPTKPYWNNHTDTIARLQDAHALLRDILQSVEAYRYAYVPQLDVNRWKHRFRGKDVCGHYAGMHYVGHLPFPQVYEDAKYYNLQLNLADTDSRQVRFTLEDLSGENPELAHFEDVTFQFNKNQVTKKYPLELLEKRFADIRIIKQKKQNFLLRLKYKDRLIDLKAQAVEVPRDDQSEFTIHQRYRSYARLYRQQQKAFDEALAQQLDQALLIWPALQLLLPKNIPADEAMLEGIEEALTYWDPDQSGYWPTEIPATSRGIILETIPGYTFLRDGGRFFQPHLTGDLLDREAWYALMRDFSPDFNGMVPIYSDVYVALENPVPMLKLRGLGVFNLDVLKRFEEEQEMLARFENENGELLTIMKTEIINHRLNGLLRFTGPKIHLDVGSPSTIVAHTADGKVYYLGPQDLEQLALRGEKRFTFRLKPLGDYVARPELVRELLYPS